MYTLCRLLRKGIKYLSLLILVYFLVVLLAPCIKIEGDKESSQDITIYLLSNGVHTDLVMPSKTEQKDWTSVFAAENTLGGLPEQWIAVGWGDKGFYLETPTWADLKLSTALSAVLGLGPATLHATYFPAMESCRNCTAIQISHRQYQRLIDYVEKTLQWQNGKPILIQTPLVYGERDAFYEAKGRYSLFFSCNTWINNGLKSIGADAVLWTFTDFGLLGTSGITRR